MKGTQTVYVTGVDLSKLQRYQYRPQDDIAGFALALSWAGNDGPSMEG